jgi:hydrogenase nickel incorporation protein HypA/HybF
MHELSIAQSIVDLLDDYIVRYGAAQVKSVHVLIGEAHSVAVEALTFSFEMLANLDPMLAGAQLLVDIEPHRARCHTCELDFPIIGFVVQCPLCQKWNARVISGTAFQVLEMDVEE